MGVRRTASGSSVDAAPREVARLLTPYLCRIGPPFDVDATPERLPVGVPLFQRCKVAIGESQQVRDAKEANPCLIATSGSDATVSVHCGGTKQTVLSSTHSNSRLPERL